MNEYIKSIAQDVTSGSEAGRLTFPDVLANLATAKVESYICDLRRGTKTYYLPDGDSVEIVATHVDAPIAAAFDADGVQQAVRRSQANAHTYSQFCERVMKAGCAGYIVSLLGRRVIYFGRTGETYVEHFPVNA